MSHPLLPDLSENTDDELNKKLQDVTKKYYSTHNPNLRSQLMMVMTDIQFILASRLAKRQIEPSEEMKELDNLIDIK